MKETYFGRTARKLFHKRSLYFLGLAIAVGLTILGLGFSLQAGVGGRDDIGHSGDLAYLQVEAEDASAVEYVALIRLGMACSAEAFAGAEITAVVDGRIEAKAIEDAAAVGLCIRADYGYGNVLYEKYGDEGSFIGLNLQFPARRLDDSTSPAPLLRVGIGPGRLDEDESISSSRFAEYVQLEHRSSACSAEAFVDAIPVHAANGQLIDLGVDASGDGFSARILCFRVDYGLGNYIYEVYGGGSGIIFDRNRGEDSLAEETLADLTAAAPTAERLAYVVFDYPGRSCGATAFNIDADFVVFSPPEYPETLIEEEVLEATDALCFRANYGDGRYAYEKYGGRKIEIKPHYKLTLSIERHDGRLLIHSTTDVFSWQFVRSDSDGSFDGYYRCGEGLASLESPAVADSQTDYPDHGLRVLVIRLSQEDYGLRYCIKARDAQDSTAYLLTEVVDADFRVDVIQAGNRLQAQVDQPETIVDWRAVKTSGSCSPFSFIARTKWQESSSFELTRRDHDRHYCFRVTDKYDAAVFQLSPRINMAFRPEIASVEQFAAAVLAEVEDAPPASLFGLYAKSWRVYRVDQPACGEDVAASASQIILDDDELHKYRPALLVPLVADDIGHYLCFAIDYKGGFSHYRSSERIAAFSSQPAAEQEVAVGRYGDWMIARANQSVFWSAYFVQNQDDCSVLTGLGGDYFGSRPDTRFSRYAYVRLFKGDNGKHLCFFAGAASRGDTDEEDLGEEGEQHVSPLIAGVQGERPPSQTSEYLYAAPETIDSGQDFADFLRPYLTDKGLEILDELEGSIFLDSEEDFVAACGSAGGCYHPPYDLDNCGEEDDCPDAPNNKPEIHLPWSGDYNGLPYSVKQNYFHADLGTFIHEFMHATDSQDPEIGGLSGQSWACLYPEEDTGFRSSGSYEDLISSSRYTQCLDDSHPLFRQLRDFYDDLPPEPDRTSLLYSETYMYLTNIHGRWGWGAADSVHQRHWPLWYTELYAESIFVGDLPPGLEDHYGQYFKDKSELIDMLKTTPHSY